MLLPLLLGLMVLLLVEVMMWMLLVGIQMQLGSGLGSHRLMLRWCTGIRGGRSASRSVLEKADYYVFSLARKKERERECMELYVMRMAYSEQRDIIYAT